MTTPPTAGEKAYRIWVEHTYRCGTCRASVLCPTSARLGRAWRAAR